MSVWRPCVSARPCESCREPISPGAWVYHGEVVRLYWCEACTLKRVGRTPGASEIPTAYLAPKPAKAGLHMVKLTDAAPKDWAKAAAGDEE